MRRLWSSLLIFLRREDGPTAVEYAILLTFVIVVCIAAVTTLGQTERLDYRSVSRTLRHANHNAS